MGILSNKISREELKLGDHIYSWRIAYLYAYHGIYVGDNKVIQFTRGDRRTFLDKILVSSAANIPPCLTCENRLDSDCDGVVSSCLDCFLAGGNLYLYKYNVSCVAFLAKPRGGTCTLARSDPPEDVFARANILLSRGTCFGDYDVIGNNCEDFAIYCKTGLMVSKKTWLGLGGQASTVGAPTCAAAVLGVCGLLVTSIGLHSFGRLASDIGNPWRSVVKVPVEEIGFKQGKLTAVRCCEVSKQDQRKHVIPW